MKITFDPKFIARKPRDAYNIMENKVTKAVKQRECVDGAGFYSEIMTIGDSFFKKNQADLMNNNSLRFAETLVNLGESKLAGVIYSALIKLNKFNRPFVEKLATNALAIAKRNNDTVHIMARADDLAKIYQHTQYGGAKHLEMLYTEKRALATICKSYANVQSRYSTLTRQMKPVESYEKMLAAVKVDIARIIKDKSPKDAKIELKEASVMLDKYGEGRISKIIQSLLEELN